MHAYSCMLCEERIIPLQAFDGRDSWSTSFTKAAYFRPDIVDATVLQYAGDERVATEFPHGNAKATTRNFVRTQPSVLRQIEASTGFPQTVYQSLVLAGTATPAPATSLPRNAMQVQNAMSNAKNKSR